MKVLLGILLTLCCVTSFADDACNPTDPASIKKFSDVYWASQTKSVQALKGNAVMSLCQELANKVEKIDMVVMCWGWDPCTTMTVRINGGYTWVPSILQPSPVCAPNIDCAPFNAPSYDPNHPPAGSIKVSNKFADYKSSSPSPSPTPAGPKVIVGALSYGKVYYDGKDDNMTLYPDGATYKDSRGTFTKHVVMGLMGNSITWTLK